MDNIIHCTGTNCLFVRCGLHSLRLNDQLANVLFSNLVCVFSKRSFVSGLGVTSLTRQKHLLTQAYIINVSADWLQ